MTLPSQEDELDRILTRLEQLGLAPMAIEKIASGDVFEAHNEAKAELSALIAKAEADKLGWAWGIIANAGKIWDEDTKEAKEWREVAWKLEKDYYDHIDKLKDGDE